MGLIDRSAILAAQDLKTEDVDMPEWGGSVRVREFSATALLRFWDACRDAEGELLRDRVQPALLARTVVGEDNEPMFNDADIGLLMTKSAAAVGRLFLVAKRLNGIGEAAEDIAKNSDAAPSGASPSDSA